MKSPGNSERQRERGADGGGGGGADVTAAEASRARGGTEVIFTGEARRQTGSQSLRGLVVNG